MKKILCLLIAVVLAFSVTACNSTDKADPTESKEVKKEAYTISKDVKEGSVINSVMTDIGADNEILKKTTAEWLDTAVIYEVNVRQYTEEGTFNAFSQHLERLYDMGVNTLWFMPIHPISKTERKGTLGSYYSVDDYMAVNPEFGTIEDFKKLVDTAHKMGFKVILDWVANHTGWDNKWVSEHPDWYMHDDNGEITYPYDWSDVAELNYDNYEMRAEMIKCMQYWVEDIGVDGFRCDHAVGVPGPFWNAAVYKLKSINPQIMMLAEASAAQSLTSYAFDCCYNDNFYGQALSIKNGVSPTSLYEGMKKNSNYCDGSFAMNYLDNHDKNSYDGTIVSSYGEYYPMLLSVMFLAPGAPMIYTTNEAGIDHSIEFFEKDTVDWPDDFKYEKLIKALSKIKSSNPSLYSTTDSLEMLETEDSDVFAFVREKDDNKVLFVSNFSKEDKKVLFDIPTGFENGAKCLLHYNELVFDSKGRDCRADDMKKDLKPMEIFVYAAK